MGRFGFISKSDNSSEPAPWMKKLMNAAGRSWDSEGSMNVDFEQCDNHWHMNVSPSIREFAGGGETDGAQVFARFTFNLPRFMKVFDKTPRVRFHGSVESQLPPGLDISGPVLGMEVFVAVFGMPLPGQPVTEVAYVTGPKEGMVEPRVSNLEEDE